MSSTPRSRYRSARRARAADSRTHGLHHDASMYQVEPIGVVIPRHASDVHATVEVARQNQVALLPRGGGTSLTGQTVNRAVVMDFSRYMNQVLEVNTEERWARVQPGLV